MPGAGPFSTGSQQDPSRSPRRSRWPSPCAWPASVVSQALSVPQRAGLPQAHACACFCREGAGGYPSPTPLHDCGPPWFGCRVSWVSCVSAHGRPVCPPEYLGLLLLSHGTLSPPLRYCVSFIRRGLAQSQSPSSRAPLPSPQR